MKFTNKSFLRIVAVVIALSLLAYFFRDRFTFNKSSGLNLPTNNSENNGDESTSNSPLETSAAGLKNNPTLDFDTSTPQLPELRPTETDSMTTSTEVENTVVENPLCPLKTSSYKLILKCPHLPEAIKNILKKQNYRITKEDCDIESRTTNITLGKHFIAWTLHQTNSCENKAYPQGLSEEKTYILQDASEVIFGDHFNLQGLEKRYRAQVDLKSGIDEQGQRCSSVKESNRNKILGSLESELTKSQFRLVDNGQKVTLEIQTFFQGKLGRVCSMRMQVKDWHSFLVKDSRFHKNQKPSEIFKQ